MKHLLKTTGALLLAALALGVALAAGGSTATAVSKPVDVTNDLYANNEESLGMSPNGALLAGAWNDWEYNDGCGFSYSTDGGDHWAPESFVPGMTNFTNDPDVAPLVPSIYAVAGDPAVAYNPKSGLFDVVCQAFGAQAGRIQLLATTFDASKADPAADVNTSYGRAAWRLPATPVATGTSNGSQKGSTGQFPDHETITVDTNPSSPFYGRLYVGWAEFNGFGRSPINVAFSDDDGAHWTGPIRVSDNANQFDQDATPVVGPHGKLYMAFINGPNETSFKNNRALIDVSYDGGRTWGTDAVASPIPSPFSGLPNSRYRVFSDVRAAVDQRTGRVLVVYTDTASGAAQVWATYTRTPGDLATFTPAARVKPTGQEQFFPWLSSAPSGRIDLVYYDRSCDPRGDTLNCVTLSSTSDGGTSWSHVSLLKQGFDGDKYSTCLAFGDPQACGRKFLGDYIAVASNDAKAQALWTGNGPRGMDVFSGRASFLP